MYTVLLVEDNEMNRDMLSRRLQRRGYAVELAGDGLEAIRLTKQLRPDIVLMDIGLPKLDGHDATRALKADPETFPIPVIALTAHAMTDDRRKALESGCDDYETKPVELTRLLEKMDFWIQHSGPNPNHTAQEQASAPALQESL
jgi:CheY-like chemotaxis protein